MKTVNNINMKTTSVKSAAIDKSYSWMNRDLESQPNEVWIDMIGYDGRYEISNMGRIKSLPTLRSAPSGGEYYTKPRIMKNKIEGGSRHLRIYVRNGVNQPAFSVGKQVALHFIDTFDYQNSPLWYRDGDVLNVQLDNLVILTENNFKDVLRNQRSRLNSVAAAYLDSIGYNRCGKCFNILQHKNFHNTRSTPSKRSTVGVCKSCRSSRL